MKYAFSFVAILHQLLLIGGSWTLAYGDCGSEHFLLRP